MMPAKRKQSRVLLLALAGLLLLLLLFAARQEQQGVTFAGTDDRAAALIEENGSGETGWFAGLWQFPGGLEGPLFVLQAALGAGILGYCLGYLRGRQQGKEGARGDR